MPKSGRRFLPLAVLFVAGAAMVCLPSGSRAGVVGSPHDFITPGQQTVDTTIAPGGVCSPCHAPHKADSADNSFLWSRTLTLYRSNLTMNGTTHPLNYLSPPTLQCYDCHDRHDSTMDGVTYTYGNPDYTKFSSTHKPQDIAAGFRLNHHGSYDSNNMAEDDWIGTVSGYYENNPPYSSNYGANPSLNTSDNTELEKSGGHYLKSSTIPTVATGFKRGDKLPCRDCHDPHQYADNWEAFMRPTLGGRALSAPVRASSYMANDWAKNPRSAANDGPSRTLCATCHSYSNVRNPVAFSAVNSAYSGAWGNIPYPPETTAAGDNIAEHHSDSAISHDTACVSCHKHNSIEASCSSCHSYPGEDNSVSGHTLSAVHAKHVGAPGAGGTANSRRYRCTMCHFNFNHNQSNVTGSADWGTQFNAAKVDIRFDNSWNPPNADGPKYNGVWARSTDNAAPGNGGTGVCAGLYCHGNNPGLNSGWGGTGTTPRWDNTAGCGSCHGITGTSMTQGNHPTHLDNVSRPYGPQGLTCSGTTGCHAAYDLSPTGTHANNQYDLRTSSSDNTPRTLADAAMAVCQKCHSAYNSSEGVGDTLVRTPANWDNASYQVGCITCHNNSSGLQGTQYVDGSGDKAPNIEAYWTFSGHGSSAIDNTTTTIDNGAVDQFPPVRCETCHDIASLHIGTAKDATNPWRLFNLGGSNNPAGGQFDNTCATQCHRTAVPANHTWNVMLTGLPYDNAKASTKEEQDTHPTSTWIQRWEKADKYQIPSLSSDKMPLHTAITNINPVYDNNSLVLCVSCHDPHGVGSALAAPRTFTGSNNGSMSPDTVHMLRYDWKQAGQTDPLCRKCHV